MGESLVSRMATRAALIPLGNSGSPNGSRKLITPRLGNLASKVGRGGNGVSAATQSITWASEGQPLNVDWSAEELARQAYQGQVYVQRGCRMIADTIAQLPWVAGPDPTDPANYDKSAKLANLLGPSTPQAPGGPNPVTSARTFWSWSIIQYIVTGRWGWEVEYDPTPQRAVRGKRPPTDREIIGLWPLVSAALAPKPTMQGTAWFDGFQYTPATGMIDLPADKVIYCWRPSIIDWRQAESMLTSGTYPIYIANAINKYMANLLKNDLVATTLVVGPPIEEPEFRRAWQDQFLSKFTGVQNKGSTIFAEVEYGDDENTGKPLIQIERLAQTPLDAGLMQMLEVAKSDICIALGVPKSLMGEAEGNTFANADAEWRNFWTTTLLNLITEIQDHINLSLAPRLDGAANVGWFDLSKVEALQPAAVFTPPMVTEAIQTGIATPEQIAAMLNIPPANDAPVADGDSNTSTIERHDLDPIMLRSIRSEILRRHGQNTWTLRGERKAVPFEREHITVRTPKTTPKLTSGIRQAEELTQRALDIRANMVASRTTQTVHSKLAEHYPESTLGWVDNAEWSGPKSVKVDDIVMGRRPGGRDMDKVAGIAQGIAEKAPGAIAPVMLVKTPGSDRLKVADGYHRTLAHKRLNHDTVPAYVAEVEDENGPWDEQMHDEKLNRDALDALDLRELDELDALGDALALVEP